MFSRVPEVEEAKVGEPDERAAGSVVQRQEVDETKGARMFLITRGQVWHESVLHHEPERWRVEGKDTS